MRIRRKVKRTTKQYFIVAIICIAVIGGAAIFASIAITGQIRKKYQTLLTQAYSDLSINQRNAYVAIKDIMSGEAISEENTVKKTVYASQPQEIYITEEDLGKISRLDIYAGTQLIQSMLTEKLVSSELRELEYNVISVSSNITNNDTIDIRICYPNGESYIVLTKKVLKSYIPETASCYLWMDEEEILRMSAAIVDAGLYPGTTLFVTKYIEPDIQSASAVTYTPSLSILMLMENDPNILEQCSRELSKEVRKALENRLADSIGMDVSSISWDIPEQEFDQDSRLDTIPEEDPKDKETIYEATSDNTNDYDNSSELGDASDYLIYAQEEEVGEGEIEYGE